jgi:hypothetical protein
MPLSFACFPAQRPSVLWFSWPFTVLKPLALYAIMHYIPLLATAFAALAVAAPVSRDYGQDSFEALGASGDDSTCMIDPPQPGADFQGVVPSVAASSVPATPVSIQLSVAVIATSSAAASYVAVSSVAPVEVYPTAVSLTAAAPTSTIAYSTAAAPTPSSTVSSSYTDIALYQHSIHRINHSANDLAWNTELAGYAATVAASCVFAHDVYEAPNSPIWAESLTMVQF